MDTKIKTEPVDIESYIKEERELIIEDGWSPIKFENEETEYYKEFMEECNQNMLYETVVKNESGYEKFTIEYLNEGDDYEDDDYAESEIDGISTENDSEEEDNHLQQLETELVDKQCSPGSKVLYGLELKKWINDNFIYRECPVCHEKFANYDLWRRHILIHKESIEDSESNYYFSSDGCGICKKCNQEFISNFSRYIHSAGHCEDPSKLNILHTICKICNFNSHRVTVRTHILEKHPEVLKDFKTSGSLTTLECPLCSNTYTRRSHLLYHFMDTHSFECNAKLRYNCHLCKQGSYNEQDYFLQHLIEKHDLNSWKILNFRKIFEDKDIFACTNCNRIFFQNNICTLLRHFLNHEKKFRWSCKFCCKKYNFKMLPVSHMCVKMVRYYEKNYKELNVAKMREDKEKTERKIKNVQEFEEHIIHVCPFCNKEFRKMIKWQQHLRAKHEIDTLKGLEMKVVANDSSKLSCTFCHTVVANSPQQLHEHRFQHLPYKPYKCLFCPKTLNTFKMAANHVLQKCKDDNMPVKKIDDPMYDIRSDLEAQCSYCNYQENNDLKNVFKHYEDEHNYFEEFFIKQSNNTMTCKVCHKQYEKDTYFDHLHHHFDEKAFKCKLCLRSYTTYRNVYNHLLNFHHVKPINKQSNVKKTDKISIFLNKEDKVSNATKLPQLNKASIKTHVLNEFTDFISYACPECNECLTTQENWHTHIETQHNFFDESNLYIRDTDGSLKCPTCGMALSNVVHQQRHKLTHMPYRSYICNLCYARCNSLGVLYGHFRRKHFAQGTFKCPICPQILQTEHGRTLHLKEMHPLNEWPDSICLVCYKVLMRKSSLNNHMAIHAADRFKYTCDVCGTKIILLRDFTLHMDRHKMRGEIKEKMEGDITNQPIRANSQTIQSNDVVHLNESDPDHLQKRKYITRFSANKKKKNDE